MVDPHLIWVWAGPTIALVVQTVIFWYVVLSTYRYIHIADRYITRRFRYRKYDNDEFMTYEESPTLNERALEGDHARPETISEESEDEKQGQKSEKVG